MVATPIFWIFTPKLGEDFHFDEYFSDRLKPPPRGEFLFFLGGGNVSEGQGSHSFYEKLLGSFATFSRFCFGVRMKCLFSVCFDYPVVNMAESPKGGKIQGWYKLHGNCANYFYSSVFLGGCFVHMFYFHPDPWGNDPIWRAYFQMAWFNWFNHQLE